MNTRGWVEMVGRDFAYAVRTLRRGRGFAAVAALTLALGIGANTAIFTLLDQVLLRLLPVKNPQQLVLLTMRGKHYGNNWGGNAISYPMYRDFQDLEAAFWRRPANRGENGADQQTRDDDYRSGAGGL